MRGKAPMIVLLVAAAVTALLGAQLGASAMAFLIGPVLTLRKAKMECKQSAEFKLVSRAPTGACEKVMFKVEYRSTQSANELGKRTPLGEVVRRPLGAIRAKLTERYEP